VHIYEKPPLGTGFAGPLHFGGMLSAKLVSPQKNSEVKEISLLQNLHVFASCYSH